MVQLLNLKISSWLLLAICARFSAQAYTGYWLNYNKNPVSHDELNDRQTLEEGLPFNDQSKGHYNLYDRDDSVASTTLAPAISVPLRSSSSRRDGWTPIIRSQTTSNQRDSYAKIPPPHRVDGVKREPAGSPRQSRTTGLRYGQPKQLRQFQRRPNNALKIERASTKPPPKDNLRLATFQYAPKKKDAHVLSENDIMWMHYGPLIGAHPQQVRHAVGEDLENAAAASKIGQRSYEVRESDEYDADAQPHPQNIYQVIDGRTSPTFAVVGLTKRQTTTELWLDDEPSSESSVQTYKFGYNDRLVREPPRDGGQTAAHSTRLDDDVDFEGVETVADTKYARPNVDGFVRLAATSTAVPRDDDTLNAIDSFEPAAHPIIKENASVTPTKSGRLLDSPIVIVEPQTTTLTPEYYRQLFDSFSSGHYRQADADGPPPNKKPALRTEEKLLPASSTAVTMPARSVAVSTAEPEPSVSKQLATQMTKRNETEKSNSSFFTVSSHQLMDLLPETLRVNLVAVKRVLIDCYTNNNKSGSVNCFKKITFDVLDKAIESDVLELTDAVSLVKDKKTASGQGRSATSRSIDRTEWLPNVIERIQQLFHTHVLKVKLMNSKESDNYKVEGRRRNRHTLRRIFPVVASIYMIVTSVLMPLVFQFMAVMAGKSFTVGKIALLFALLTSFNKFLSIGIDNILPWYLQPNHASSSPPPPPAPPLFPIPYPVPFNHYNHQKRDNRKKDTGVYSYSYTTKRVPVNYAYYTLE